MKKTICFLLLLACILSGFYGCASLNQKPVTLAESMSIPENGIVEAAVFETLKKENKAAVFEGQSGSIRYEWILFGGEIPEAKDLNLGIEITESENRKVAFRFCSEEDFGFTPGLSFYLNDTWGAKNAFVCEGSVSETGKKQEASITGEKQNILNFSPEVQRGTFVILPGDEPHTENRDSLSDVTDTPSIPEYPPEFPPDLPIQTTENPDGSEPSYNSGRPISDGKNEEPDRYQTDPVPEGKPLPVEPDSENTDPRKSYTCTFSIECTSILNHLETLNPEKLDVIPKNGILFAPQAVTFYEGESVYDVLQRVCRENGIPMEASWTPMYNSAYVEGIGNLYEFDCGKGSGWMYRADGWYPNYGCSRYQIKQGERIEWRYTCDLGRDIGGTYATGG